jgi:hypothetical protein
MKAALHEAVRRTVDGFLGQRSFTTREAVDSIRCEVGEAVPEATILAALDDYCAFGSFVDDPDERLRLHRRQLAAMERLLATAVALGVEADEPVIEGVSRRFRERRLS